MLTIDYLKLRHFTLDELSYYLPTFYYHGSSGGAGGADIISVSYEGEKYTLALKILLDLQLSRGLECLTSLVKYAAQSILHAIIELKSERNSFESFYNAQINGF